MKSSLRKEITIVFIGVMAAAMVLIGVIPMFGYNIDKQMRDEMYIELNARRAGTAQQINDAYENGDSAE